MRVRFLLCLVPLLTLFAPSRIRADDQDRGEQASDAPVEFVRDIQPVFSERCFECHGVETREAGLRLDRRTEALAGGDSGVAIVPGEPDDSLLFQHVSGVDPDSVMPPDGEPLSDQQIALIRKWIEQGADWPESADVAAESVDHWAYQPIQQDGFPQLDDPTSLGHEIDAFVHARLESAGIQPSPEADRHTLIKRLYYDLLGLVPDPRTVDRFVNDPADDAYTKLVDELLDSPHFGERWGRHWLDMARYADSDGYEKDRPRYNAWKYRDWVIDAVNADMPFNQFTIEQLAGDLLPDPTSRSVTCDRVSSSDVDKYRRRHRSGGVPGRRHYGSGGDAGDGLAGIDRRLCAMPLAQIRSAHPARVLRTVRVLQQRRRS